jgi:hypothetical protein
VKIQSEMFASAKDALLHLVEAKERQNRITNTSPGILWLSSGPKYYQMEVTTEDGTQQEISAYDEEAEELFNVAKSKTHQNMGLASNFG